MTIEVKNTRNTVNTKIDCKICERITKIITKRNKKYG